MMELFRDELASRMAISVGHRAELVEYHSRTLMLTRHRAGVTMSSKESGSRASRLTGLPRRPRGTEAVPLPRHGPLT
jgi:hypothetical protein